MIPSHLMRHLIESLRRIFTTTWPSLLVAVVAWISIVSCIDPAGSYPSMPQGPGLTIDEIFNVQQGVYLVEHARALGWFNLVPGTSLESFQPKNHYNPDHPPLGRYWLGIHHHLTWWMAPPFEPDGPFVTACARTGSATAFALTVWLVGVVASCISCVSISSNVGKVDDALPTTEHEPSSNRYSAFFASTALVLMPRVYGHAHLASLETITNLTCTAAVSAIVVGWSASTRPSCRTAILAGIVMGLAMLTKIQAILIPIPVILWALWRWRMNAMVPLVVWGLTAIIVFFAGWPYLWLDPVGHFQEYLGRTTNRVTLYCYYFGQRYADRSVPWHYPFAMFAMTVPLGWHLFGIFGLKASKPSASISPNLVTCETEKRGLGDRGSTCAAKEAPGLRPNLPTPATPGAWQKRLLLGCMLFPLVVFAAPGVAVYDGERLFLTVFPLWAIFVGHGMQSVCHAMKCRFGHSYAAVATILVLIGYQITWQQCDAPMHLSYYNELTFGRSGAEQLGMEMDYWGCSVTRDFLAEIAASLPAGARLAISPTLHPFQADEYRKQSPILRRRTIKTVPANTRFDAVIVYRRRADLPDRQSGSLDQHATVLSTSPSVRDLTAAKSSWLACALQSGLPQDIKPFLLQDLRYP